MGAAPLAGEIFYCPMARINEKRESFIFYFDWVKSAQMLDDDNRLKFYDAICNYALTGEEPTDLLIRVATSTAIVKIAKDKDKYEAKCERNKEIALEREKARTNTNVHERVPKSTNVTDNDNDNKNDNDNDNDTTNVVDNNVDANASMSATADAAIDFNALVDFWNDTTNEFWKIKKPLGQKRKQSIKARIAQYGKNEFASAIRRVAASKYLHEQTWFNFDWFIRPNNFEKIISGNYDKMDINTQNSNGNGTIQSTAERVNSAREAARIGYAMFMAEQQQQDNER